MEIRPELFNEILVEAGLPCEMRALHLLFLIRDIKIPSHATSFTKIATLCSCRMVPVILAGGKKKLTDVN